MLLLLLISLLVAELLAEKTGLNKPLSYLLVGFVGSELITRNGIDLILRADSFSILVFQGLLPLILFEMTLSMVKPRAVELAKNAGLAIYLLVMFIFVSSMIIYLLMNQPEHFPFIAALLTVAVIAAIEPACSQLNIAATQIDHNVRSQIETETVINDALAAVFFSFTLIIAQQKGSFDQISGDFFISLARLIFGGIIAGALCGYLTLALQRLYQSKTAHLLLSISTAYSSYFLAEAVLASSGVVAVLIAGIIYRSSAASSPLFKSLNKTWKSIGYHSDAILFLLLGMTFTLEMFSQRWLAMLITVFGLVAARLLAGITGYWIFKPSYQLIPKKQMLNGIIMGNYSGALAIALVLSLPEDLAYWWTIQSMVFGVVLYSLIIQLPVFNYLNQRFKANKQSS
jgi:CPA1 family monovalent cation:H+ antiporter